LGPFQATLDGKPAEGLNSDTLRALLAYLAVESKREHPREQIAALLWPERSDHEARDSLRFALSKLHSALDDRRADSPFLMVNRTHVQFNLASDHWLDVSELSAISFQLSAASYPNLGVPPGSSASGGQRAEIERMTAAVELYRGPFLAGLSIADSPAFEEWMLLKGEEIHRSLLAMLDRLAVYQMRAGESGQAARWARKQLELEPYREQAHRQLMQALALGGECSAALTHYETCRRLLAEELGCQRKMRPRRWLPRSGMGPWLPSNPARSPWLNQTNRAFARLRAGRPGQRRAQPSSPARES
jgi:DNA-binding SARP family transcriptional activator